MPSNCILSAAITINNSLPSILSLSRNQSTTRSQQKLEWLKSESNCASFPTNSSKNANSSLSNTSDDRPRASAATPLSSITSTNSPSSTLTYNPPHRPKSLLIPSNPNKWTNNPKPSPPTPLPKSPTTRATKAQSANQPLKTSQTSWRSTSGSSTNTWPSMRHKSRRPWRV